MKQAALTAVMGGLGMVVVTNTTAGYAASDLQAPSHASLQSSSQSTSQSSPVRSSGTTQTDNTVLKLVQSAVPRDGAPTVPPMKGSTSVTIPLVRLHTSHGQTICMTVSDSLGISVNKVGIMDVDLAVWKVLTDIMGVQVTAN